MPDFSQRILSILKRAGSTGLRGVDVARGVKAKRSELPEIKQAIQDLLDRGAIRRGSGGKLRLGKSGAGRVAGVIRKTSSGKGFLIPDDRALCPDDVLIYPEDLGDAQSGDAVLVELKRRRSGGRAIGRVVKVVSRDTHLFVGRYFERDGQGYVEVDGQAFPEPVAVGDPGAKGARLDDKVVIEMVRFPSPGLAGEAVLTEVLGPRGAPGVDTLSIIREFNLPDEFPPDVLADARQQADKFNEHEIGDRLDLTGELIVTIDPVDARDFDDAISLARTEPGGWRLGVHVADVSHFVVPGSPLDREARRRGTSVYLPDRVLPMLPEVLSNLLASLQAGRLRYTQSVFIEYDADGLVLNVQFARSAIRVQRRFAYEEVLPIVRGEADGNPPVTPEVRGLLERMHEFAMQLRARRFARGALELTLPETKLDFDADGRVIGAHQAAHDASHQIIEEFMLAANVAVATALHDRKVPFMRRVHGEPDVAKLRAFAEFVGSLGFRLKKFQSRRDLQTLLDRVQSEPTAPAVNYAFLRSLKQAEYSVEELGHYALAVSQYCHFTSPIRRYPDLTVHRLVGRLLAEPPAPAPPKKSRSEAELKQSSVAHKKKKGEGRSAPPGSQLAAVARHCSQTERKAAAAERELTKVKLLTCLADKVGEELDAVITGVQPWGFYCQGLGLPAEGSVRAATLTDDYYRYDVGAQSLVGNHGRVFRLGDKVRVVIALVDVPRRVLEFRVAEGSEPIHVPPAPRPPRAPRKPRDQGRGRGPRRRR